MGTPFLYAYFYVSSLCSQTSATLKLACLKYYTVNVSNAGINVSSISKCNPICVLCWSGLFVCALAHIHRCARLSVDLSCVCDLLLFGSMTDVFVSEVYIMSATLNNCWSISLSPVYFDAKSQD